MSEHEPQRLDKVWLGTRQREGKQPNGYITSVHKEDGDITEVHVRFYANQDGTVDEHVSISYHEMEGTYKSEGLGFVIE